MEQYPWAVVRILSNYVKEAMSSPRSIWTGTANSNSRKFPDRAASFVQKTYRFVLCLQKRAPGNSGEGIDLQDGYDPLADPMFLYWKVRYYDYLYLLLEKIILVIRDHCQQKWDPFAFLASGRSASNFPAPASQSWLITIFPENA